MPPHISATDFVKLRKEVVQLSAQLQLQRVIQQQQQQQIQLQQQLIKQLQQPVYRASSTPMKRRGVTNPEESLNIEEEIAALSIEAPMKLDGES